MLARIAHNLQIRGKPRSPRCMSISSKPWLTAPMTFSAKSDGRFGKQDFVYLADENVYRCPAGEKLKYRFTAEEHGQKHHRYWTEACHTCPIKAQCTTGRERRITRWEQEEVVEAV
jgi:Transposase DDE domain